MTVTERARGPVGIAVMQTLAQPDSGQLAGLASRTELLETPTFDNSISDSSIQQAALSGLARTSNGKRSGPSL